MQTNLYTPLEINSDYEILKNVAAVVALLLIAVFLIRLYAQLYRSDN